MVILFEHKLKHRLILQDDQGKQICISRRQETYQLALDLLKVYKQFIEEVEIAMLANKIKELKK